MTRRAPARIRGLVAALLAIWLAGLTPAVLHAQVTPPAPVLGPRSTTPPASSSADGIGATWTGEFHYVNYSFNGTPVNLSVPLTFRIDSSGRVNGEVSMEQGAGAARGTLSGQATDQSVSLAANLKVDSADTAFAEDQLGIPNLGNFDLRLTSDRVYYEGSGLAASGTGTLNAMDPACMQDLARLASGECGRIDIPLAWSASGPNFAQQVAVPTPADETDVTDSEAATSSISDLTPDDERLDDLIVLILTLGAGALAGALGAALGGALGAMGDGRAWWIDDIYGGNLSSLGVEPPELPWLKLSGEDLDTDAYWAGYRFRNPDGSFDFDGLSRHFGDIYGLPPGDEQPPWMDDATFENAKKLRTLAVARAAELGDLAGQGIFPLPPRIEIADLPPVLAVTPTTPAPKPAPRVENPFDGGNPLQGWRPGGPANSDGNPGEPGQVLWNGHWLDPGEARERIAESLAMDQQRAAGSAAFHQDSLDKSAAAMRDRVLQGEREEFERIQRDNQDLSDQQRRAALADGIETTISDMHGSDARKELYGQLGTHMQNGDTAAVEAMWRMLRGDRQAQVDGFHADALANLDSASRNDWAAWGAERALNGSKAIFGAGVGALAASPVGLVAAAGWGIAGLGTIGAVEGGLVQKGGEVGFDGLGAAKGFAGGAKSGVSAAIGGVQTAGAIKVAISKLAGQASLDAAETYARTGDPYKAFTSGAISAAGNALGEVIDGSVANGLARAAANHAVNLTASTAEGVNQGQSLGDAVKSGLEGEMWGGVARGGVHRATGADGATPTVDGDYDPAHPKANADDTRPGRTQDEPEAVDSGDRVLGVKSDLTAGAQGGGRHAEHDGVDIRSIDANAAQRHGDSDRVDIARLETEGGGNANKGQGEEAGPLHPYSDTGALREQDAGDAVARPLATDVERPDSKHADTFSVDRERDNAYRRELEARNADRASGQAKMDRDIADSKATAAQAQAKAASEALDAARKAGKDTLELEAEADMASAEANDANIKRAQANAAAKSAEAQATRAEALARAARDSRLASDPQAFERDSRHALQDAERDHRKAEAAVAAAAPGSQESADAILANVKAFEDLQRARSTHDAAEKALDGHLVETAKAKAATADLIDKFVGPRDASLPDGKLIVARTREEINFQARDQLKDDRGHVVSEQTVKGTPDPWNPGQDLKVHGPQSPDLPETHVLIPKSRPGGEASEQMEGFAIPRRGDATSSPNRGAIIHEELHNRDMTFDQWPHKTHEQLREGFTHLAAQEVVRNSGNQNDPAFDISRQYKPNVEIADVLRRTVGDKELFPHIFGAGGDADKVHEALGKVIRDPGSGGGDQSDSAIRRDNIDKGKAALDQIAAKMQKQDFDGALEIAKSLEDGSYRTFHDDATLDRPLTPAEAQQIRAGAQDLQPPGGQASGSDGESQIGHGDQTPGRGLTEGELRRELDRQDMPPSISGQSSDQTPPPGPVGPQAPPDNQGSPTGSARDEKSARSEQPAPAEPPAAPAPEAKPPDPEGADQSPSRVEALQEINRDRVDAIRKLSRTKPDTPEAADLNARIEDLTKARDELRKGMTPDQIEEGKLRPLEPMNPGTLAPLPPHANPTAECENIRGVTNEQVAELRDEVAKLPGALQANAMGSRVRLPEDVAAANPFRRDPAKMSDVDVLVVCDKVDDAAKAAAHKMSVEMSAKLNKEINIVVVTREDFSRGPEWHKIPGVEIR